MTLSETTRIESASRVILATPRTLFRTFLDAETLAAWRTPDGMTSSIADHDPRVGGGYTITMHRGPDAPATMDKAGLCEGVAKIHFRVFAPDEQIVEEIHVTSDDLASVEPMRLMISFDPDRDGTRVTLRAENVPDRITPKEQEASMRASLSRLARLTE